MAGNAGSPIDKLLGVCMSILIGAAAVFIAVKLIEAVWTALLVILGVAAFAAIAWVLLRTRRDSW
jgi:hypothetical protein